MPPLSTAIPFSSHACTEPWGENRLYQHLPFPLEPTTANCSTAVFTDNSGEPVGRRPSSNSQIKLFLSQLTRFAHTRCLGVIVRVSSIVPERQRCPPPPYRFPSHQSCSSHNHHPSEEDDGQAVIRIGSGRC